MKCKSCGAQIEEGMLFCQECGAKVEKEEKPMFTFEPVKPAENKSETGSCFADIRNALDKLEAKVNAAPKFDPAIAAKLEDCEKKNAALKEENANLALKAASLEDQNAKLKAENEQLQQRFAAIQSLFMGAVPNTSAAPAPTPAPAPAPEPIPVTAPAKKVCPTCGAPVEDGAVFCGECGTRI